VVTIFFYGKLYGAQFIADSAGHSCHYQYVTTIIRSLMSREMQGLYFMYGVSGKLWILMDALLHFLNIKQNTCIFQWTRKRGCSKISTAFQFDHANAKKMDKKGICSGH